METSSASAISAAEQESIKAAKVRQELQDELDAVRNLRRALEAQNQTRYPPVPSPAPPNEPADEERKAKEEQERKERNEQAEANRKEKEAQSSPVLPSPSCLLLPVHSYPVLPS